MCSSSVTACGILRAQSDHAVVVAREQDELLEPPLGNDFWTRYRKLVPENSQWPRDSRARVHAFGYSVTMNTTIQTARSCEKGRIQVSAGVAARLTNAGEKFG